MKTTEKLQHKKQKASKNELSQQEIAAGITTFSLPDVPNIPVLETPEGKVNGAQPKAFKGQQSSQP